MNEKELFELLRSYSGYIETVYNCPYVDDEIIIEFINEAKEGQA